MEKYVNEIEKKSKFLVKNKDFTGSSTGWTLKFDLIGVKTREDAERIAKRFFDAFTLDSITREKKILREQKTISDNTFEFEQITNVLEKHTELLVVHDKIIKELEKKKSEK